MQNKSSIAAVKIVAMALEEVHAFNGMLPSYADAEEEDGPPPESFLALAKQYAGDRVPESELVATVDAVAALFPAYQLRWK
jgi:hypothetical protein